MSKLVSKTIYTNPLHSLVGRIWHPAVNQGATIAAKSVQFKVPSPVPVSMQLYLYISGE